MINIRITGNSLSMEGHARSAERGRDIVCAAASMLLFTLAEAICMLEKTGAAKSVASVFDKGKAELKWEAVTGREKECNIATKAVLGGFRILADRYPEYVKVQG